MTVAPTSLGRVRSCRCGYHATIPDSGWFGLFTHVSKDCLGESPRDFLVPCHMRLLVLSFLHLILDSTPLPRRQFNIHMLYPFHYLLLSQVIPGAPEHHSCVTLRSSRTLRRLCPHSSPGNGRVVSLSFNSGWQRPPSFIPPREVQSIKRKTRTPSSIHPTHGYATAQHQTASLVISVGR